MAAIVKERQYAAELLGANEVPPVSTSGIGSADINWVDSRLLFFRLEIRNLAGITEAHIHLGRPNQNGPVVAFLFGPTAGTASSSLNTSGYIRRSDLVGPLKGRTLSTLAREMDRGNAYVNVHTSQHPNGAIRGQIIVLGNREVASPGDAWRDGRWS